MKTLQGMFNLKGILFVGLGIIMLSACTKKNDVPDPVKPVQDTTTLLLKFNATANEAPLDMSTAFNDPLGRSMFVEQFKYYISNVSLIQGENAIPVWKVALIIHENNGDETANKQSAKLAVKAPAGSYSGIRFGVGLDPVLNAMSPNMFLSSHPMSADKGTYWDAWTAYRFIGIEGKADIDGDGDYSDFIGFHTGRDTCYREVEFFKAFTVNNGSIKVLNFNIEINDIFFGGDTLDIATEPSWHGQPETITRGIRISDNFAANLELK